MVENAFFLVSLFCALLLVLSLSLELVEIVVELSLGLEDFLSALSGGRFTFGSLSRTRGFCFLLPCIAVVIYRMARFCIGYSGIDGFLGFGFDFGGDFFGIGFGAGFCSLWDDWFFGIGFSLPFDDDFGLLFSLDFDFSFDFFYSAFFGFTCFYCFLFVTFSYLLISYFCRLAFYCFLYSALISSCLCCMSSGLSCS